jgi:hypothetical protein
VADNDNLAGSASNIFSVTMAGPTDFFAPTYREARAGLLEAARSTEAVVTSHRHPGPSPDESPLFTDVVRVGPQEARQMLLVISGTHGVEGFAGSAIQTATLHAVRTRPLPRDTAMILIHALNPYGFAWCRRVDAQNIDVNRNLMDHAADAPENPDYELLHGLLCPQEWSEATRSAGARTLSDFQARHGRTSLENALAKGQCSHHDGLFFGGRGPSWSIQLLRSTLATTVMHAERIILLDVHTGLGSYGGCQLICGIDEGSSRVAAVRHWLGDGALFFGAASGYQRMAGAIDSGIAALLDGIEVTAVTVEFGTLPTLDVLQALRADNWLHRHRARPDLNDPIKQDMRRAFNPQDDDWRELVLVRGRQVIARALQGLQA